MYLGYNSNGLLCHDPLDALDLVAETGFAGIGITIDHHWLNPAADDFHTQRERFGSRIRKLGLRSVIETGARFLLDGRNRHEPTLLSDSEAGRQRRIGFLCDCIDIAGELESDCVSCWSGRSSRETSGEQALDRLCSSLEPVLRHAEHRRMPIGFEPEPGMFIDTLDSWERFVARMDSPWLQLTLDIGHLHCQGELPLARRIHESAPRLVNVHIEDMRAGVHEHLPFGEGEIDFVPVVQALATCGYHGGVFVELGRHSHEAVRMVRESFAYLTQALDKARADKSGRADSGNLTH